MQAPGWAFFVLSRVCRGSWNRKSAKCRLESRPVPDPDAGVADHNNKRSRRSRWGHPMPMWRNGTVTGA